MGFKMVGELPKGVAKAKKNTSTVFTDELADACRDNPGKWFLVEDAKAQGAAAWVKRMDEIEKGFRYESVDTGKPDGPKKKAPKGDGMYQPTIKEIYVRFNPEA